MQKIQQEVPSNDESNGASPGQEQKPKISKFGTFSQWALVAQASQKRKPCNEVTAGSKPAFTFPSKSPQKNNDIFSNQLSPEPKKIGLSSILKNLDLSKS